MKKRRAKQGDKLILINTPPMGRKTFVLKENPQVEIHLPAGTVVRFWRRIYLSGMRGPNGARGPGGYGPTTVEISYQRTAVFDVTGKVKAAVRPVLNWQDGRSFAAYVRGKRAAKVLHVP